MSVFAEATKMLVGYIYIRSAPCADTSSTKAWLLWPSFPTSPDVYQLEGQGFLQDERVSVPGF